MGSHSMGKAPKKKGRFRRILSRLNPLHYLKLIMAMAGAGASAWSATSTGDGIVTYPELFNTFVAVLAAFQVWYVTETNANPRAKAFMAGLAAALVAANTFLYEGLTTSEWIQTAVAAGTAAAVFITPNKKIVEQG